MTDPDSVDRDYVLRLIEAEAALCGMSASEAIAKVKTGQAGPGYVWDDISLLVSLISD